MLEFRPDDEQQMLKTAVHRFAEEKVRKVFREAEEIGKIPADVTAAGWEIGLLPTGLPEQYGGFGEYSALTNALAVEEFAWGDFAITLDIMRPNLLAVPLMLDGSDAQKEQYLPLFCDEKAPHVTAAMTEPVIQFDPRQLNTTATKENDNYVLNGHKTMVPAADTAELFLIYANENGQTQAFFVPANTPGMNVDKRAKFMGINALPTYEISFENCQIPAANRLGGEAGCNIDRILTHSRIALGAAAVGLMRAGYEYALEYAKQRVQFGRPIAQNQSIAFMLAEMAIDIDEARLMVWEAAWKLDRGEDVAYDATIMKFHIDDMVVKVADQALQTLGGYGYIREYPVELWLRNARGLAHMDGMLIA
ncbi:MAG: acyl-CoA dehydrogenase family protein [Ardenticatenaceae bacterium]|nr:acyl-CoA dehydrogenase family protein [Ardenticatenaceae bacterium]